MKERLHREARRFAVLALGLNSRDNKKLEIESVPPRDNGWIVDIADCRLLFANCRFRNGINRQSSIGNWQCSGSTRYRAVVLILMPRKRTQHLPQASLPVDHELAHHV